MLCSLHTAEHSLLSAMFLCSSILTHFRYMSKNAALPRPAVTAEFFSMFCVFFAVSLCFKIQRFLLLATDFLSDFQLCVLFTSSLCPETQKVFVLVPYLQSTTSWSFISVTILHFYGAMCTRLSHLVTTLRDGLQKRCIQRNIIRCDITDNQEPKRVNVTNRMNIGKIK